MGGTLTAEPDTDSTNTASPGCANSPNTKMSISPNRMNVPAAAMRRLMLIGAPVAAASVVTGSTPSGRPRGPRPWPGAAGTSPG